MGGGMADLRAAESLAQIVQRLQRERSSAPPTAYADSPLPACARYISRRFLSRYPPKQYTAPGGPTHRDSVKSALPRSRPCSIPMTSGQARAASLFATLDAEAVMQQIMASPFLQSQQQPASESAGAKSPTLLVATTGATPVPPTPVSTAFLSPTASIATLMSGLNLQSAGGPASPTDSSSHTSLADAVDGCFSTDALTPSGSDLSLGGSMELPPALHALLQQHAQQRTARSASEANSALLGSGGPSTPASPANLGGARHRPFSGFAAASAAGAQALPLEVQAYLQQEKQQQQLQQQQQQQAAATAAAAAAAQEQQASLAWASAGSTGGQGLESFSDADAAQAWPAASPGVAAFQAAVFGWGGQPLSLEQQAAAAAAHGTLPQALFSLQLPQRLQLQALLAQQQQLLHQQQQQQGYGCGATVYPSGMQQVSTYALRRADQAPQDPPEALLGPNGRYQPYCKQFITSELNVAAQNVLCTVKMLQYIDGTRTSRREPKRFFCSLKEVSKVVCEARCLIVAPDVQPSSTAAINPVRALQRILSDAQSCGVPVVFALSRRGIGQVFGRDKAMSIVAVMRLDGLEPYLTSLLQAAAQGRLAYMKHRDVGALPLEARLLGSAAAASSVPATLATLGGLDASSHTLASAQSLASPQGGLGGAMPQWLQTLQAQTQPGALHSLPSVHNMPASW